MRIVVEMMVRMKWVFERDEVAVAGTTATSRRKVMMMMMMGVWVDEGVREGDMVEIEWVECEDGEVWEVMYVEVLEWINEAFARASERTKREREAKRRRDEGKGEDEKGLRSVSVMLKVLLVKGMSVGKWMSEVMWMWLKLKVVAERERLNEENE